jgi:hypothetical protein
MGRCPKCPSDNVDRFHAMAMIYFLETVFHQIIHYFRGSRIVFKAKNYEKYLDIASYTGSHRFEERASFFPHFIC